MSYDAGAVVDGLQQIVDALAGRLGRSVAVDDSHGRVLTVSRHFGDEDPLRVYAVLQRHSDPRVLAHFRTYGIYDWSAPGRVPGEPALDFKARICCPARAHGLLFGHLFLIDDGVRDWEIELAAAAAAEVGLLMYRRVVLHEDAQARREDLARQLVSDSAAERERARHALGEEFDLADIASATAVVVHVAGPAERSAAAETAVRAAAERVLRERTGNAGKALSAVRGRRGMVLLFGDVTADDPARLGTRWVAELAARCPGERVVAGIGRAAGVDAAVEAYASARLCARAAALLPQLGDVVSEDDLGVYALLLRLPRTELVDSRLPAGLRDLRAHDSGGVLVQTLEAYLDCGGDATRTAARLRVHRSTLYYRLGRIETFSGARLHDGGTRLVLHVGVKLLRVLEALGAHPELDTEH